MSSRKTDMGPLQRQEVGRKREGQEKKRKRHAAGRAALALDAVSPSLGTQLGQEDSSDGPGQDWPPFSSQFPPGASPARGCSAAPQR